VVADTRVADGAEITLFVKLHRDEDLRRLVGFCLVTSCAEQAAGHISVATPAPNHAMRCRQPMRGGTPGR
jgi:hypothetical protein